MSAARRDRVAVVIITRDRVDELVRTLGHLQALPERPQIVVVDHASRDGTAGRVRRDFPAVTVIESERDLGAAGRTLGAERVDVPYVAFCDDDSWWAAGSLAGGADVLDAHPTVALVAARVLLGPDATLEPACAAMAASPLRGGHKLPGPRILGFVACGAIVRRSAFLQAGGFAVGAGVGGEERLLAADLAAGGWDLVYREDLVVHHHPSAVRDRFRRRAAQVRNDLLFAWLRRPPRAVLRATLAAARAARRERAAGAGLVAALGAMPRMLARRRAVPPALEADLRRLEHADQRLRRTGVPSIGVRITE